MSGYFAPGDLDVRAAWRLNGEVLRYYHINNSKALLRKFNESGNQSQFARLVMLIMITAKIADTRRRYKVISNRLLGCMKDLPFCTLTI
jgi:hypothetical protein